MNWKPLSLVCAMSAASALVAESRNAVRGSELNAANLRLIWPPPDDTLIAVLSTEDKALDVA